MEATKINKSFKLLVFTLTLFLASESCFYADHWVFAQNEQTTSNLQTATRAVAQAFSAIMDAEKAGGNVTQLLLKLNNAGKYLTDAQNAYNSGNMINVVSDAESARQIAEQVSVDALNLRSASLIESQNSFWMTFVFSFVGAFVFIFSLLIVWRRFKRSFMKKLLGMKLRW
jgi:hypothetical protein